MSFEKVTGPETVGRSIADSVETSSAKDRESFMAQSLQGSVVEWIIYIAGNVAHARRVRAPQAVTNASETTIGCLATRLE